MSEQPEPTRRYPIVLAEVRFFNLAGRNLAAPSFELSDDPGRVGDAEIVSTLIELTGLRGFLKMGTALSKAESGALAELV
jgi:hypothetical protein